MKFGPSSLPSSPLRMGLLACLLATLPFILDAVSTSTPSAAEDSTAQDVVLITIDTLRADAVGFAGNEVVSTPTLDRLAKEGRVFRRAHAHNVVTLPSHANLLTGLYPYQHGVRDNEGYRLPEDVHVLPEILRTAGYRTGAFVSAFPLDSLFGLDRGFEVYDDDVPKGGQDDAFVMAERRGDATVAKALDWWNETPGPRFLWLHLYDPHAPYDAPSPFAERYPSNPYLAEVAATDHFLAALLDPFFQAPETAPLVIMTSDHGEALGDHGELTHGLFAYEATLAVPLVLWGPGVKPGVDDRPARHIDIFPTVLDALKLASPTVQDASMEPLGHSLLEPSQGDDVTTYFEALSAALNRGWAPLYGNIQDGQKLIALPLPELYDLPKDPKEQTNLVRQERRRAAELRDVLPSRQRIWPPGGERQVDAETSEALQALGYLGGNASVKDNYGPEDDPKNLVHLDRKLHQAIDLYSRGELDDALALTTQIVTERPNMGIGVSLHVQTLLQAGRRDDALQAMLAAQERGDTTTALQRQLGLTLSEAGRHTDAVAVLRPLAADGDPRNVQPLALALSESGQHDGARQLLESLSKDDPDDAVTWQHLSLVALRQERWAEAEAHARQALRHNPRLPRALNNLGVALLQQNRLDDALDAWQQAVDLDATLYDALYNLGTQAMDAGRRDQAYLALQRFVDTAPDADYRLDLRRARVRLRRLERQQTP